MIAGVVRRAPDLLRRTSAGYGNELGLGNYVLTQGLASKVFVPPATASKDTLMLPGDGWLDVKRTETLWDSVFTGPRRSRRATTGSTVRPSAFRTSTSRRG